jgi:ornithine cyclodeaminase
VEEGKLPPLTEHLSLGGIASGTQTGRVSDDERIALMTGGMPVEDGAWSYEIYTKAKAMGLGQMLTLWDEAHWM